MMKHENIVALYGHRREKDNEYMFMEYACGGELFDRIGKFYLVKVKSRH